MVSFITHWLTPHYTNNHRPRLLQPVGLSVVVGLFLLFQTTLQLLSATPSLPGGFVLGYASSISPSQVLEKTNAERAQAGLPPFVVNEKLNQAALAKANHMFQNDYWAHVAPDGTSPWVFIKNAGYAYSVAGENLARDFGDTSSMVRAWMNSATHKANIVHQKYTQTGIAVVDGKLQGVETTLVVQLFGLPSGLVPQTSDQGAQSDKVVQKQAVQATPAPTAVPIAQLEPVQPLPRMETTSLRAKSDLEQPTMVSPLTVTKVVASLLITLLVLVLAYDLLAASKRKLPRRVGNNWAHIGLFSVVLLIIVVITQGKVL